MNLWIILAIANIPIYIGFAWVIFEHDNLGDCLASFASMAEWWSGVFGTGGNPYLVWWWLGACAGTVWLEHFLLVRYVFA